MSIYLYQRLAFGESRGFAEKLYQLAEENEYIELQETLERNPEMGDVVPGTNGARKIRMAIRGKGKRGGARVVYYYLVKKAIWFLDIYPKNEKRNISEADKKRFAKAISEIKNS
jgi:hypothetical protein